MMLALAALALAQDPLVSAMDLSDDGNTLVVALSLFPGLLWLDAATGEAREARSLHSTARAIAVGERVAVLGLDREVEILGIDPGAASHSFTLRRADGVEGKSLSESVTLAFGPEGDRLLVAVPGYESVLLDGTARRVAAFGPVDHHLARSARWTADGRILVVRESALGVHDGRDGSLIRMIETGDEVRSMDAHPSLARASTGHDVRSLREWDLETGELLHRATHPEGLDQLSIGWIGYAPDGSMLAYTTTSSVMLGLIDLSTFERVDVGPFRGGASGVPAAVRWDDEATSVWTLPIWSWVAHGARIELVGEQRTVVHDAMPEIESRFEAASKGRAAVHVRGEPRRRSVGVIDLGSGDFLWRKPSYELHGPFVRLLDGD
ncbi:MAG: hypothetical protein AAGA20_17805 [Planctomycetota bacterium]